MNHSNLEIDIIEVLKNFNNRLAKNHPAAAYITKQYRYPGLVKSENSKGELKLSFQSEEKYQDVHSIVSSQEDKIEIQLIRTHLN